MPPHRELGRDPMLGRPESELVHTCDGPAKRGFVGEVSERRSAPHIQSPRKRRSRPRRIGLHQCLALPHERLEARRIDLFGRNVERVPAPAPLDPPVAQQFAQPGYVALQDVASCIGWLLAPDILDQPFGRHDPVRLKDQLRQNGTLLGPADRKRTTIIQDLHGPEHSKLHAATVRRHRGE